MPGRANARARRLAAIAFLLLWSCGRGDGSLAVRSEAIGHLGHGYRLGSLIVSRDHRHLAWVKQVAGRCRVVVDRRIGPPFPYCSDPLFSPDGATVAYWAGEKKEREQKAQLVVNGRAAAAAFGGDGPIGFGKRGGAWAAIAPAFGTVDADEDPNAHEPDSKTAARPERRLIAIAATGVLGEYYDTSAPALSPDGSHVAFVAADAAGIQRLVVDGRVARSFGPPLPSAIPTFRQRKPGPNLEPESTAAYLSDGSLVAVALGEKGWTFVHGDEVWATYAAARLPKSGFDAADPQVASQRSFLAQSLATADDAPVACWWERVEGGAERWRVACNGQPIDRQVCTYFDSDVPIAVAASTRAAAYACQINPPDSPEPPSEDSSEAPKNVWVVVGGKPLGPHRFVWGVDLSSDGTHYAYAAADTIADPWFYVVDGRRYDGPWEQAYPPKLSPDGSTVVWAASRDPKARRQDLVYDGRTVARAEMIMTPPVFRGEREVEWAVKRGNSVRRVIIGR